MFFREEGEDIGVLPFTDRAEAGCILAGKLSAYSSRKDVIVLALPRGGVPVASAVAQALHIPLDVFVGGKLGTPGEPELAIGAVAGGGLEIIDLSLLNLLRISEKHTQEVSAGCQIGMQTLRQHDA